MVHVPYFESMNERRLDLSIVTDRYTNIETHILTTVITPAAYVH